ncbi:MAG TPA: ATPase, partial [Sphingobacteriaceae bacterium]|nr:ATPase [Sphingobacteriaceae bacterium]
MSGKEDKPENYANVIYSLEPKDDSTRITISQDNINDEAQLQHMEQNWGMVLSL